MKHDRKYSKYIALSSALRRAKVKNYGANASLLLSAFLEDEGRILSSRVTALGLCEDGKFSEWRKELVEKGWLSWNATQTDKGKYSPGKRLISYINQERLISKEIVTKDDVLSKSEAATKIEVQQLRDELNQVKVSMEKVYDKLGLGPVDPPGYAKLIEHTSSNFIN